MGDTQVDEQWPQHKVQRPLEQEVYLNLVRTFEHLSADLNKLCKARGVSPFQYNVLRILRGAGPEGLPSLSIADRMVNRIPDITRLIDRLEGSGLVERSRSGADRRVVRVHLTQKSLDLLAEMDQPLIDMHLRQLSHLSKEQLHTLDTLLTQAREGG